jgi:hypothetical protein
MSLDDKYKYHEDVWGNRGITAHIRNHCTSEKKWVVSFTSRPFYSRGKSPPGTQWIEDWVGSKAGWDSVEKTKPLSGIEPRSLDSLAHSAVSRLPTEMSRLPFVFGRNLHFILLYIVKYWSLPYIQFAGSLNPKSTYN